MKDFWGAYDEKRRKLSRTMRPTVSEDERDQLNRKVMIYIYLDAIQCNITTSSQTKTYARVLIHSTCRERDAQQTLLTIQCYLQLYQGYSVMQGS